MDQIIKTKYNSVRIYDINYQDDMIRMMDINGGHQSACYMNEDKKTKLVVEYTKYYNLMFHVTDCKQVLMIGGGGYSYPKFLVSNFPDTSIDVVEIDEGITEIAKRYMFLQEFLDTYNSNDKKRINLITADGREYLNNCDKKYDAILNDAYDGDKPIKEFLTLEFLQTLKDKLQPNGVYITNIISALEGESSKTIKNEVKTLEQVFANVFVIPCLENTNVNSITNNIVIATDKKMDFNKKYIFKDTEDRTIYKD